MGESNILKSGELFLQEKNFLRTTWVNKFCLLHGKTAESHPYMELFDDQKSYEEHRNKSKKCDKRIDLQNIKAIKSSTESTAKGAEYQIEIRLKLHKHFIMFRKENDFRDWLTKLNSLMDGSGSAEGSSSWSNDMNSDDDDDEVVTLNQMYGSAGAVERYVVEVDPSSLAKLCGIVGQMTLLLGNDIAFEDPKTKTLKYSFQLAWLRRFGKYKTKQFNFEVGRKCPNGEGTITCQTDSAKQIHQLVTLKSASRSKTVIPHQHGDSEKKPVSEPGASTEEKHPDPVPVPAERTTGIGQPVMATNMQRRHPGISKMPNLIPIQKDETAQNPSPPPVRRDSTSKVLRTSTKEPEYEDCNTVSSKDNGHFRAPSYRAAVKSTSEDFTKELEKKLHVSHDDTQPAVGHEPVKKESVKTREEKKREKEEKKEKERREKEEKKERERLEKEKKKMSKKEKSKHADRSKSVDFKITKRENLYDEPENLPKSSSAGDVEDPSSLYDEACTPTPQISSQGQKQSKSVKGKPDQTVYAEPYTKTGGVVVTTGDTYAAVSIQKDAWKKLGRNEDLVHEEDYSNIKSARENLEMDKKAGPPDLPVRNYGEEDLVDDTYDTTDWKKKPRKAEKPENVYGIQSAKDVGPLPVQVPEADYSSGESLEEENTYAEPDYEGYEAPSDLQQNNVQKTRVVEAYEETAVPIKPKPPAKPVHVKEQLYEEIP